MCSLIKSLKPFVKLPSLRGFFFEPFVFKGVSFFKLFFFKLFLFKVFLF